MTTSETYYRTHWEQIDPEHIPIYEELFRWRPNMEPMLTGAQIAPGLRVVDYGCGPGFLAIELAKRVGPSGRVVGCDLNEEFLRRAQARADTEGVGAQVDWCHIVDGRIPAEDASVDRVICKNVLEYVPDLHATLSEFRRVLKPGGLAHAIDSDWGALIIEPLGPERVAHLLTAAQPAYKEPLAGRKLYGAMRQAGFGEVKLEVLARPDTRGLLFPIVMGLMVYAQEFGRLTPDEADMITTDCQTAINDGTYMLFLPQFLATGLK